MPRAPTTKSPCRPSTRTATHPRHRSFKPRADDPRGRRPARALAGAELHGRDDLGDPLGARAWLPALRDRAGARVEAAGRAPAARRVTPLARDGDSARDRVVVVLVRL